MKAIESRPVTKRVKLAPKLPHLENLPQDLGSRDPNVLWTLLLALNLTNRLNQALVEIDTAQPMLVLEMF